MKSFIGKMNTKAADLGLKNTHFDSFDGISRPARTTPTPRDLAKLARSAMKQLDVPRRREGDEVHERTRPPSTGGTRTYTWYNTNRCSAPTAAPSASRPAPARLPGTCLVFAATRGDKTVIGVVLTTPRRPPHQDAAKLLDFGFGSSTAQTMHGSDAAAGAQRD